MRLKPAPTVYNYQTSLHEMICYLHYNREVGVGGGGREGSQRTTREGECNTRGRRAGLLARGLGTPGMQRTHTGTTYWTLHARTPMADMSRAVD